MKQLLAIRSENEDSEKQVNKLNNFLVLYKSIPLLVSVLFLGTVFQARSQDKIPYDQGKTYILADIDVTGKVTFNKQNVILYSGLEKGQSITVPGEEISNAIKKLGEVELFSEIDFYINRIEGDSVYLELNLIELPKLREVKITGVKKSKTEGLIKDNALTVGKIVNENLITTTKNYIENKYKKDGYYSTKVNVVTTPDTTSGNEVKMLISVDKGEKVKVTSINFEGNEMFSDKKLRSAMSNTKQKNFFRVLKRSKYIKDKYEKDLKSIVNKYKEKGYRDARITTDSVIYNKKENNIAINIGLVEGKRYYFGSIKFLGNSVYPDQGLRNLLGIKKGDVYNGVLLEKRIANKTEQDANDITNLYQNNGYLFSQINAVEVRTTNDTIDFEIRIMEGPLAYFNKITVVGNDKTNDKVIYRELRTKPGEKYSKEDLVRTVREIGALGFFDAEAIEPKFKNVDPAAGTVDIEWNLAERGSSQIELQGGYGGGGFIGTLGLSFNNFSIQNIFKKEAYRPVPMGDGQKVALRLQGSNFFQTYSLNFSEPWFGGKKPVSFNSSLSYSKQFLNDFRSNQVDKDKSFNIISLSIGLSKRLTVPDNDSFLSQALSFQFYDLNNYNTGLIPFKDGTVRNFAYTIGFTHTNKGSNPIYPMYGSEFSISAKVTPPYSLFNGIDYGDLGNQKEFKRRYGPEDNFPVVNNFAQDVQFGDFLQVTYDDGGNATYTKVEDSNYQNASADDAKVKQEKFKWLEYYKVKMKADWYTKIYDKLVLRSLGEFGYLGNYNSERGDVPFERFFLGGDGLANFAMDGREMVQLRGYPNQSLTPLIQDPNTGISMQDGATIYNKFSLELRYPITLKPQASIYVLAFAEAGAAFNSFKSYNPFELKRSAGVGLRVFMPAFGLLGIDFAHGFDPLPGGSTPNGAEVHFIIGQQF
jgi:outer membrane protein insertion porin family